MTFAINAFGPGLSAASAPLSTLTNSRDEHAAAPDMLEISALNKLVVAVLDNADEYRRAIFGVEQLLDSLQHGLYNRVQAAEQLQSRVRALGAEPATSLSSLAAVFAARLNIQGTFAKDRPEDLLQDAARGEEALRLQFKKQLGVARLSLGSRECIRQAIMQISADRTAAVDKWDPFDVVSPRALLTPVVNLCTHAAHSDEGSSVSSAERPLAANKVLADRDSCPTIPTMT